ncbi:glycosyltransferase family 2 protein [Streptococcus suis]|uniref:glycosyltransferase family 2 protein n=1 Tax=Streptococcus suis TaxID=1307 RepID=UPI000CF60391|nr:glycosyltransferase family 2 protein [Streptococcus suis]
MDRLVSIIIPVYNLEEYLEVSIPSILNQTYQNLEVIVVNDGSTDNSVDILEKYSADRRLKVYSQKNEGLSAARNLGLEKANGFYIYFFDGDDSLHPIAIEKCVEVLDKNNLDVFSFKSKDVFSKNDLQIYNQISMESACFQEVDFNYFTENVVNQDLIRYEMWTKVFRKDFLVDIKFKVSQPFEDVYFNLELLNRKPKYFASNYVFHNYLKQRSGNTNTRSFSYTRLWVYHEFEKWLTLLDRDEIRNNFVCSILKFTFGQYQIFYSDKYAKQIFHIQYKKYYSFPKVWNSKNTLGKKIALILFRYFPALISIIYRGK